MRAVRIWFSKEGRAKYVSHLDMNRCFTRAVRRAGLPVWYTEGFNPHPYLNFLTPLPLGQESAAEPLDVKLDGDVTDDEIHARLNDVLPEGIAVTRVAEPVDTASAIAMADYEASLIFADEQAAQAFARQAEALLDGGQLTAEKTGKQGHRKVQKQVNLCENVHRRAIDAEGAACVMRVTLPCGNQRNVNPALLIDALKRETDIAPELTCVRRTGLLKADFAAFG